MSVCGKWAALEHQRFTAMGRTVSEIEPRQVSAFAEAVALSAMRAVSGATSTILISISARIALDRFGCRGDRQV
ncbi:hypothetical protein [Bradyrhizobium sp. Gha]|uniref:hypothetical protein n=1 Tax=Bradyrhizobium sp. Gha TaxID=1855318 RepID=UPI0015A615F2|nr:hypothetical protein [Bradyrhizobium sp. Gha]